MSTIIICTDFSKTSRNALAYACNLIQSKARQNEIELLLLHVFDIPKNYSGEGLSIITINDEWNDAQTQMEDELQWVHEQYPDLIVRSKITTGALLDGIMEQIREENPILVVIGASGNFGDLWSWDKDILELLKDAPVPVLTIPQQVSFVPIHNIGLSCNLKNVNQNTPFETVKKWVQFTGAPLHVLSVTQPELKDMKNEQNKTLVLNQLKEVHPEYHVVEEAQVVGAIGHFVHDQQINLLMVMPKKHGVWENLFRKSYTKELMRLNAIPILALHGK